MATRGSKNGTRKAAAPKPAARPKASPGKVVAAPKAEKSASSAADALPVEPAPAVQAVAEQAIEVAAKPVQAAAQTATTSAAVAPTAADTAVEETKMIETNTAKAQAFFADLNDRTNAAVEKSTRLVEEANEFAKGNVEALVESGRIAAKGFETLSQDAAEYGRKSFESATAALKTFATVKSPAELFKLQSDFVRGAFDSYVAEASKNTEALIKLAGDAAQPLSNRFAVAVEKVKTAA